MEPLSLLKQWCDALLEYRVEKLHPRLDGALLCPACQVVHGRCGELVYPLLCLADRTGEARYLDAARKLFEWSESLACDDGSIYIIRCLDDNDEEARQSAIDSEIESRKTALFSEKYAEIQDDSSKFKVDEDVIDTIRFTTPVYVAPSEEETSESETSGEETSESETGEKESTKEEKSSESDESEEAVSEASSEEESK